MSDNAHDTISGDACLKKPFAVDTMMDEVRSVLERDAMSLV
jgi:hypothetical protein